MSSLNPADIRVIAKIVQILRQDHSLNLQFQDPQLTEKIQTKVNEVNDPVLAALWASLSISHSEPKPTKPAPESTEPKRKNVKYYRGQAVAAQEKPTAPPATNEAPSEKSTSGHYITYRGKKKWVEH